MDKEQPLLYRLGITALTFFLFVWYFLLAFFPIGMIGLALIDWFGLPAECVLPVCLCLAPILLFVILHYLITPKKDDEGIYECLFHFTFAAEVFIVAICLINANVQDEISDAYLDGYDKGYSSGYDQGFDVGYSVSHKTGATVSRSSAGYDAVDDEMVDEWGDAYDNHVSVDLEEFYIAYSLIDDYLSGESDSINLAEVYQLLEEGIGYFYDATEISSSDNWQVQDYKIDLQDSIEPIKSADRELEEYLMGNPDSFDLVKVKELMEKGFEQFYKVYD